MGYRTRRHEMVAGMRIRLNKLPWWAVAGAVAIPVEVAILGVSAWYYFCGAVYWAVIGWWLLSRRQGA